MQRLEVSGAVRPIYVSLGFKRLTRIVCHAEYVIFLVDTVLVNTTGTQNPAKHV